eukprot:Gb_36208 [translate_table: standard]
MQTPVLLHTPDLCSKVIGARSKKCPSRVPFNGIDFILMPRKCFDRARIPKFTNIYHFVC